jgi:rhamnose transport system permease protein
MQRLLEAERPPRFWVVSRAWSRRETALALVLLCVVVGFGAGSPEFRNPVTLLDQSRYWIEIGIMAPAMLLLILIRGIDLSVASTLALCGVTIVRLNAEAGVPIGVAALIGLGVGALAGLVNGLLATFARIPDLVVTLATMVIYRGLAQVVLQNRVYSNLPEGYRYIGEQALFGIVPVQWIVMLGAWAAFAVVLHCTSSGRYAYAMGASPLAARFAAVPARSLRVLFYTISGFMAGVAAIVYTARNNTAKSDDAMGFELDVITCVVLGGASIRGGRGSMFGCMLAVLILGLSRTGLMLTAVPDLYQRLATGAVLIVTAALNEWMACRRARSVS